MQITESKLKQFRSDYNKAMELLEVKYGVSVQAGRITYDSTEFRFKTTVLASQPKLVEVVNLTMQPANAIIRVGDTVIVNHKKANGKKFQVVKVNRIRMKLRDLDSKQLFNAPKSLIQKIQS